MLPKKIHYCWLSGEEIPPILKKCMQTWKEFLPDYEFILWDKKKFDTNSIPFVKEAVSVKKWAFAADYIRLFAVHSEGGIYLDSDVIVKKNLDVFLENDFFTAVEDNIHESGDKRFQIQAAIFGAAAGHPFVKDCMDWYKDKHFILPDGSFFNSIIAPEIYAETAKKYGFVKKDEFQQLNNNMTIYPSIVFPNNKYSKETYAIHSCIGSWQDRGLLKRFISPVYRTIRSLKELRKK